MTIVKPDTNDAYGKVMDAIVTQKLAPSQKVSENILSDMFAISRSVAKNLIERLVAQQFLVSLSPRVTQVAALTLLDIRQNFVLRKMLMSEAVSLAAPKINLEEVYPLSEKINQQMKFDDDESALELLKTNKAINLLICNAAGYPLMLEWIGQLEDTAMRIYWLYLKTQNAFPYSSSQHHSVLDTIALDDPKLAKQTIQEMLMQTEERILNAVFSRTALLTQDLLI